MNLLSRVVAATAVLALAAARIAERRSGCGTAAEAVAQPDPITFPRTLTSDAGTVVLHTPQIDSWKDLRQARRDASRSQ